VLVGPPGAGKTTVGALLADQLSTLFRDTDADIEAVTGRTIPEIFIDEGEDAFRKLEVAAVKAALEEHDGVLSVGGGAVLSAETRERLATHFVVFLDVSLADATRRTGLSAPRPLLAINPRAQLHVMLEARRPLYAEVANACISTSARTPAQIVHDVLDAMQM
jgi:shikimate kinase